MTVKILVDSIAKLQSFFEMAIEYAEKHKAVSVLNED